MHHARVPNPRTFPGLVQFALAIAVMLVLWLLAAALGVPDGWDAFTGIVLGGVLLGLWEAFARPS